MSYQNNSKNTYKNDKRSGSDTGTYDKRDGSDKEPEQPKRPLKSINNRRCLTQCNGINQTYFHPIILTGVAGYMYNTCAIDPVYDVKKGNMIYTDICNLEDNSKYELPTELGAIFLNFDFHYRDFLSNMYGLNSFDQVIYWTLENDYLPFDTIKRVHNCAWKAYGLKVENLSDKVFEYYYELIQTHWIVNYYNILNQKYIFREMIDGKLSITRNVTGEHVSASEKLFELIIFYYFNYSFFIRVIKRYLKVYKNVWDDIDSHYVNLKKFCFKYLVHNIKKDLPKK